MLPADLLKISQLQFFRGVSRVSHSCDQKLSKGEGMYGDCCAGGYRKWEEILHTYITFRIEVGVAVRRKISEPPPRSRVNKFRLEEKAAGHL